MRAMQPGNIRTDIASSQVMTLALRSYLPHRSRVHRPGDNGEDGLGWQELRREYIRLYCGVSNVQTAAGREQCDKVCGDHFCCFETATHGHSCQYDESTACQVDYACRNISPGPLNDYEETDIREDNDVLAPPTLAGFNLPPVDFGEAPSPPVGDDFGVQQMRARVDEQKKEERDSLIESLILMELEEETGSEVNVVRKYLTRSYNPFDPRTTCYNSLYQSDEDGDALLQKSEYANFIADLSEGAVGHENFLDLPLAFKVNFIYLSCQCEFHPNLNAHGGGECCLGPDSGIHISGAGPNEVPTIEDDAHLQLVCLNTKGTIDSERGPVPGTIVPTDSLVTYSPTEQPTKLVSNPPTVHPSPGPSSSFFISSDQPEYFPGMAQPTQTQNPTTEKPTQVEFPLSSSHVRRPSSIPSGEPSSRRGALDDVAAGDAESGITPEVVVGVILCMIIFGLCTVLFSVVKLKKDDGNRSTDDLRARREANYHYQKLDSETHEMENIDTQDDTFLQAACTREASQKDYSFFSGASDDESKSTGTTSPTSISSGDRVVLPNKSHHSFESKESSGVQGVNLALIASIPEIDAESPQSDNVLKNEQIMNIPTLWAIEETGELPSKAAACSASSTEKQTENDKEESSSIAEDLKQAANTNSFSSDAKGADDWLPSNPPKGDSCKLAEVSDNDSLLPPITGTSLEEFLSDSEESDGFLDFLNLINSSTKRPREKTERLPRATAGVSVDKQKTHGDISTDKLRAQRVVDNLEADSDADREENNGIQEIKALPSACTARFQAQWEADRWELDLDTGQEDAEEEDSGVSESSDAASNDLAHSSSIEEPIAPPFRCISSLDESISSSSAGISEKNVEANVEANANSPQSGSTKLKYEQITNLESIVPAQLPAHQEDNDLTVPPESVFHANWWQNVDY